MQIIRFFLFLAVVGTGIGGLCYVYKIGPFRPLLSRERYFVIREVIRTTPSAVIVFGDSIVQEAPLPSSVCGTPIVNAGVAGAGIDYFVRYSNEFLDASTPKLIVLAVGINDAHKETLPSFRSQYQRAVTALSQRAPLVLATIAPVEPGTFTQTIVPEALPRLNETIKDMGETIIDLNEQMIGSRRPTPKPRTPRRRSRVPTHETRSIIDRVAVCERCRSGMRWERRVGLPNLTPNLMADGGA